MFDNFDRRWGETLAMLPVEREALGQHLEAMRVAMDATIERERKELYAAFSVERAAVMADATRMGKELGSHLLTKLKEVVAEMLLLLSLLVLLLIGLPFLSGFIAGRATARRSRLPGEPPVR